MGQVYLGRSTSGRLVAVKTIRPELAEEAGFRTRFAQEVAAARRVSGVYTAAVVEADADADVPWLATAYIAAPSLRRLVKTCGVLPPATVRWLAAGCAEALQSIHAVGLVHMDLKPSNVLVAADGPRVIDFGVARAASRLGGLGGGASSKSPAGTPAYMAPEQARDLHQASVASDVFSLGGTLLFAATGHAPYHGETTADVLVQLATESPDLAGLPTELDALVRSCLERTPVRRPSSAALLTRLGEFAEPDSYLPESALAMIRGYQRATVPSARATSAARSAAPASGDDADEDERTANSYPGLPASARPEIPAPSLRSVRYRLPAWAGWAAAGGALVTLGAVLGATLVSSGGVPSSGSSPGSVLPNGGPPPATLGPVCASSAQPATSPALCVNTDDGNPATTFTVQARGFKPGHDVTLTVLFYPPPQGPLPPAPRKLRAVTVPANGKLQLKPAQLGLYDVVATGSPATEVVFRIDPANPQGPPAP